MCVYHFHRSGHSLSCILPTTECFTAIPVESVWGMQVDKADVLHGSNARTYARTQFLNAQIALFAVNEPDSNRNTHIRI